MTNKTIDDISREIQEKHGQVLGGIVCKELREFARLLGGFDDDASSLSYVFNNPWDIITVDSAIEAYRETFDYYQQAGDELGYNKLTHDNIDGFMVYEGEHEFIPFYAGGVRLFLIR